MPLVMSEDGLIFALQLLIDETLTLHLYANNYTPVETSVVGDFTEATFSGYSGGVALSNWTAPAIVGGVATSAADPVDQTHNGGATSNTVYGFFVKNVAGDLVWAERDPSPVVMNAAGQIYRVYPVMGSDNV